jgi:hypothetical protein
MSVVVKGFGCRPCEGMEPCVRGPTSESLQGGNRGNGYVRRYGERYGDLGAAWTTADGRLCDAASWRTEQRLLKDERAAASVAIVYVI